MTLTDIIPVLLPCSAMVGITLAYAAHLRTPRFPLGNCHVPEVTAPVAAPLTRPAIGAFSDPCFHASEVTRV